MSEQHRAFLDALVSMARRDAERAAGDKADTSARSVALWMAGEVERRAQEPGLPVEVSRSLCDEARRLRTDLLGIKPEAKIP